jgi:serine/threonine-protein kinase
MIGTTVGKYRIVDKLGRGGMGTVYKAVDQTLDREVAIKVLNPDLTDADLLKRFRGEAVTLARLNHPGIATIYELHQQDDELLMVMEYVRGETFHDLSDRLGSIAPPQAAHLCMQVLDALGHAHRGGVVHRDLKPANLMITDGGAIKVMDFGIARVLGTEHFTHGGYMMGTPAYMAPEQVLGREIDGRADLYSVGVILYRLLTGHLPFSADTAISMVQMQISEPPTPIVAFRPDLPDWCTAIMDRALAKSPSDRFQTAEEFRAALVAAVRPQALGEMPTLSTPTPGLAPDSDMTAPHRTPTPMRTSPAIPGLTANPTRPTTPTSPIRPAVSGTPTPTTTPMPERTTTVVLGRNHLMALGALLVIVAAGIAVLAFAALRGARQAPPQNAAIESAASPAPATPPAQLAASGELSAAVTPVPPPSTVPPPSIVPPPPATPPVASSVPAPPRSAPAAGTVVGQPPAGGERGVATAGAAPAVSKTASRGTSLGALPGGAPASGRGTTSKEIATTPGALPAPPAAPAAPPIIFNQVRLLVPEGDRAREREGVLHLGNGQVSIVPTGGGAPILSLQNTALTGIFYARSKQPRWRDASGQVVESKIDLGRMGFLRGERNWVILLTSGEPVILRIEDSALKTVLPALQERTGQKVQR